MRCPFTDAPAARVPRRLAAIGIPLIFTAVFLSVLLLKEGEP
jgi:hypothetical protein